MFDFVVLWLMVYGWLGIFVCFVWFCECFVYWGWVGCVLWFGCFCRFGLFDCLRLWFVFRLEFVCLGIVCRICLVFCYFVVGVGVVVRFGVGLGISCCVACFVLRVCCGF